MISNIIKLIFYFYKYKFKKLKLYFYNSLYKKIKKLSITFNNNKKIILFITEI